MNMSEKFSSFEGFHLDSILSNNEENKKVVVKGRFKGRRGTAVIQLEKLPFNTTKLSELFSGKTRLETLLNNDIYYNQVANCTASDGSGVNEMKVVMTYPAEQKHINRHKKEATSVVCETPEMYQMLTKPFIKSINRNKLQWIYNILDHKEEVDRIIFEDPNPKVGFVLLPDLEWTGEQQEGLFLQALVCRRDISCLRDLTGEHIPLLENIQKKGTEAIFTKYNLPSNKLRVYIHYQPSFYHLHVHFSSLSYNVPGISIHCGKAHLLAEVIDNLRIMSDHYQRHSVSFLISDKHALNKIYSATALNVNALNNCEMKQGISIATQTFTLVNSQLNFSVPINIVAENKGFAQKIVAPKTAFTPQKGFAKENIDKCENISGKINTVAKKKLDTKNSIDTISDTADFWNKSSSGSPFFGTQTPDLWSAPTSGLHKSNLFSSPSSDSSLSLPRSSFNSTLFGQLPNLKNPSLPSLPSAFFGQPPDLRSSHLSQSGSLHSRFMEPRSTLSKPTQVNFIKTQTTLSSPSSDFSLSLPRSSNSTMFGQLPNLKNPSLPYLSSAFFGQPPDLRSSHLLSQSSFLQPRFMELRSTLSKSTRVNFIKAQTILSKPLKQEDESECDQRLDNKGQDLQEEEDRDFQKDEGQHLHDEGDQDFQLEESQDLTNEENQEFQNSSTSSIHVSERLSYGLTESGRNKRKWMSVTIASKCAEGQENQEEEDQDFQEDEGQYLQEEQDHDFQEDEGQYLQDKEDQECQPSSIHVSGRLSYVIPKSARKKIKWMSGAVGNICVEGHASHEDETQELQNLSPSSIHVSERLSYVIPKSARKKIKWMSGAVGNICVEGHASHEDETQELQNLSPSTIHLSEHLSIRKGKKKRRGSKLLHSKLTGRKSVGI